MQLHRHNFKMILFKLLLIVLFTFCEIICAVDECDNVKLVTTEFAKSMVAKKRVNNEEIFPDKADNAFDEVKDFGDFDYIIVGAGTAGSIVAKKLADHKFKTLLIEAGGNETDFTDIPAMFRQLQFTEHNWGYYTTPQKYACQGMINKQCAFPRGKVMGGTSTIGGLTYARGNKIDQDLWSEYGIEDWTWEDVLPYYKLSENYVEELGDNAEEYHGFIGPIPIDLAKPAHYLESIFLSANKEIYDVTDDINGPNYMAAGKVQFMKKNGRRVSSAKAYLTPLPDNLMITLHSYVYKVLLDEYKMATGVLFMKNGQRYHAQAKLEVILSGGSINTPQLLMLSGIGPKSELEKHGIPVIADLPVGENLVGHVGFHGIQIQSDTKLYDKNKTITQHICEYQQSGTGTLANIAIDGMAYLSTVEETDYPDVEVFLSSRGELNVTTNNEWNLDEATLNEYTPPHNELEYVFRIAVLVIKAHSKGTVTLKSSNPKDFPLINTNSLSDERDIEIIYKGIKYVMKLLKSKAFKDINARLLKRVLPACKNTKYLSKEYWYCMIKHVSGTANHPVGTCRIGDDGVVDNQLKVRGIGSLRIADLSVAPRVNSLHTNALALAIGERAADFVVGGYWQNSTKNHNYYNVYFKYL